MEASVALSSEDLNECWLKAQAKMGEVELLLDGFFEKEAENNLRLMLSEIPPQVMEVFKMQYPQEHEKMSKFMGG